MSVYENQDVYRIVAAEGGGVRVVIPGGFATNALEERYPNARAAAAAIEDAIKDGMPAFEVVDETSSPQMAT
jgi:hypothetical protein